jgi:hypothetical protein
MSIFTNGKPYSINFEHRPDYLYVHIKGDRDSYEISNAYWTEIAQECVEHSVRRLLVDEDLAESMPSMSDVFKGASERSYMGLAGIKIAFVDRHPEHHEQNLFGELVANNRGLLCKVFNDFTSGETWLIAESA